MSNFDKDAILEQVNQLTFARLQSIGINETDINGLAEFIFSYNKIAIDLLYDLPGIQLPDTSDLIPLNEQNALQACTLFAEGIIFTLLRIQEYQIAGELINHLTQQVAMPVFEQAKQIVAATHGQEHTPEFQISPEQQAEYISQAAESALLHFINEYEKEHGPINPEPEPGTEPQADPSQAASPEQPDLPQAEVAPQQPALPASVAATASRKQEQPADTGTHEKFAAVALLLTTLSVQHRAKILNGFSPEEKELIAFYSYPQHIEQNLDASKVAAHLNQLKARFSKRDKQPQTPSGKRIASLTALIPAEKLLSCVKDERPVVARYLAACASQSVEMPDSDPAMAPTLSARLEEILYQFLTRRLSPELKQMLPSEGQPQS